MNKSKALLCSVAALGIKTTRIQKIL